MQVSRLSMPWKMLLHNNFKMTGKKFLYSTTNLDHKSIRQVNIVGDNLRVQLQNSFFDYPLVWLRDNCQCQECFHPNSRSRIIHWKSFDIDVKPESVVTDKNNKSVLIKWNDNHLSTYLIDWLYNRNFTSENRDYFLTNTYKPKRITWNKDTFESIFKKFDFTDVLNEDCYLRDWLKALSIYGVALIVNVPSADNSCRKIANRVEFIKKTHYGKEFIVRAKPGTTNVAYLSSNLQMHTDLPYYEYKPGVNLLHCVTQALGKGGENTLSDGLYAAQHLRVHDKECYRVLSQTLVDWEDHGQEESNKFHSMFRSPVICEDLDGEIIRINHSIPQRGSHFNIPIQAVKPWYKSMKTFVNVIHANAATYKVAPGEMLCFNNIRLLHGRQEYEDTPDNTRYIIGAYLDWDYIFSRMRVLDKN